MSSLLLVAYLISAPAAAPQADTIVVCPDEFRAALEPWLEYRRKQGHEFVFVSNLKSAEAIRDEIRGLAKAGQPRFVVLIGDAEPNMDRDATLRKRCVPTFFVKAKINVRWGSEPEIPSDNPYVDLDGTGIPKLAIGRITADTPDELKRIVKKTLDYETSRDFGAWRNRVNLVAGVGGFGQLADSILETAAKKFITEGVPTTFETTMTYGSWQSPYCPWPADFQKTAQDRLSEGCLFFCYIGHGARHALDRIHVPGQSFPILDCADCGKLTCAHGAPIALFLACYTGAFDDPRDCLAEELLRADQGPVAILSGSRMTMPYAMTVLSTEMMGLLFNQRCETVGELLLRAKQNSANPPQIGVNRLLMDGIASVISPQPADLAGERLEHVQLFHLFGDPLLQIRRPRVAKLKLAATALAGQKLEIQGECPVNGACRVELVCRRDALRFAPAVRTAYQPQDAGQAAEFAETYRLANNGRWTAQDSQVIDGKFATTLEIPAGASGQCHVRVIVSNHEDFALGAADLEIRPAKQK